MRDRPKLILVGDEWTQGSYSEATTSSDLAVEDSFRRFFSVTNLGFLRSSPLQSVQRLKHYLSNIHLKNNFPRSNITVVYILGNMFRDMDMTQHNILPAHQNAIEHVTNALQSIEQPDIQEEVHPTKMSLWLVGGSTDLGQNMIERIQLAHHDLFNWEIIPSWCSMVDEQYELIPYSHDPDRILLNSHVSADQYSVLESLIRKRQNYKQLQDKGLMSDDFVPTAMMTDQLAEHIHKISVDKFTKIELKGREGLHDETSKQHYLD
tara:strand:- start:575 stop:1366 length:792 start_codon:yes stop_codon:yes gene_type:complete